MHLILPWFSCVLAVALAAGLGWMYARKSPDADLTAYMATYSIGAILLMMSFGILSILGIM